MDNDIKNIDPDVLLSRQKELQKLKESSDGAKVKKMIEKDGADLMAAYERGDTARLSDALKKIISTDEGARIVEKLSGMFGENHGRNR